MKTLILHIGPKREAGHPVALFVNEGTDPRWFETPRAEAVIAEHPDFTAPLVDPGSSGFFKDPDSGEPLTGRLALERLLALEDESPTLEVIGQYLFHLMFQGQVLAEWNRLRAAYPREDPPHSEGLRLILDIRSRELEQLPWELLTGDGPRRLFLDPTLVAVRGSVDPSRRGPAPKPEWPLRVLVVVGDEAGDKRIEASWELEALEAAFHEMRHMVDHEVLHTPSRTALRKAYEGYRPHVFHFIGHGLEDVGTGRIGLHLLKGEPPWTVDLITTDLSQAPPRLAILNACYSADMPEAERLWSLAQAFRQFGTAAVVGMRGEVPGPAAATFSAELYKALAAGATLDRAVQKARTETSVQPGPGKRDWALPAAWFGVLPEEVFPSLVSGSRLLTEFRESDEYKHFLLSDFVDRKQERRQVMGSVEPAAVIPSISASHLLVVTGPSEVGKTALIYWGLEGCAHHERRLAYVDLKGGVTTGFLEVLRAIRDGDPGDPSPIKQPLPPEAFSTFNRDLNFLLRGQQPPDTKPEGHVEDEGLPFKADNVPENAPRRIFESFRAALKDAGQRPPLVLVLDNLRGVFVEDFKRYLRPWLIDPIARGELAPIRLVLAVRDTEAPELGLGERVLPPMKPLPPHRRVTLSPFSSGDFHKFVSDFLRRRYPDAQEREVIVRTLHKMKFRGQGQYVWKPSLLKTLLSLIEA
ncbi:CHAT domain-containing protein [Archangium minus]